MHMNKILRTTVGGRFIAPTADLSALRRCSGIRSILWKLIIAPAWGGDLSHWAQWIAPLRPPVSPHCTYL